MDDQEIRRRLDHIEARMPEHRRKAFRLEVIDHLERGGDIEDVFEWEEIEKHSEES